MEIMYRLSNGCSLVYDGKKYIYQYAGVTAKTEVTESTILEPPELNEELHYKMAILKKQYYSKEG